MQELYCCSCVCHITIGSSDYLCTDIDGGVWLCAYASYAESPVDLYPATFKDAADHCLLADFGMVQSQTTVDNVEFVFRHLVSVL